MQHKQPLRAVTLTCIISRRLPEAQTVTYYSRPKPSAFIIAKRKRSAMRSLEAYAGSSSVLKQVCEVGSLEESGPSRWMTQRRLPRPPMGARSLPVKNFKNRRFSSSFSSRTISHNHRTTCVYEIWGCCLCTYSWQGCQYVVTLNAGFKRAELSTVGKILRQWCAYPKYCPPVGSFIQNLYGGGHA